jgi:hypothetical protein
MRAAGWERMLAAGNERECPAFRHDGHKNHVEGRYRYECVRHIAGWAVLAFMALPVGVAAQKFYPDDPLWRDPPPLAVAKAKSRGIDEYYDFFQNTLFEPVKEQKKAHAPPPSEAINTLGEVPDSAWFTNRIGSHAMSIEELVRGPGVANAPAADQPWTVLSGKNEGITPGLVIRDSAGRRYVLKFDPMSNPEMASAADVLGSRFFYALGYNVPENYIVYFRRNQLAVGNNSKFRDSAGIDRAMKPEDVDAVLHRVPHDREGVYRGMASLFVSGDIIGPFRYYGTRSDDPNDIVDHQNRRDLRGLYVFSAWLNHTDSKSINTLDSVVETGGTRFVRHYLIDFGAILGSDSFEAKSPRAGNVYLFDFKPAAWQFLSLGLYVPAWMRADYPHLPAVGHLEYATFDPERWRNNYPNPAFDMRTPGDTYWAAKKVMAFTDADIRAIVKTAEYTNPRATEWVTRCLIERRNKIGRAFFNDVLPLDEFAVRNGRLTFQDMAVKYGFARARQYSVQWFDFDNQTSRLASIPGANTLTVPRSRSEYVAANVRAGDPAKTVTVYLRGNAVVGIDRTW